MRRDQVGQLVVFLASVREKLSTAGLLDRELSAGFRDAAVMLEDRSDSVEATVRQVNVAVATRTDGIVCPVCDNLCKTYPRGITGAWVRDLDRLYRRSVVTPDASTSPVGFLHRDVFMEETVGGGDFAKWRYWDFVEEVNVDAAKGRSGWWRIRPLGVRFLTDPTYRVRRSCYLYQSEFVRWKDDSRMVNAAEATRNTFHYQDMMNTPVG